MKNLGKASKLCISCSVKQPVCPFMMQANRKNIGLGTPHPLLKPPLAHSIPWNQGWEDCFLRGENESDPLVYKPLGRVEGHLLYFWGSDERPCPLRCQAIKQKPVAWTGNVLTGGVSLACERYTSHKGIVLLTVKCFPGTFEVNKFFLSTKEIKQQQNNQC